MAGVLSVALGGALGALARWGVGLLLAERLTSGFPWPTLCINVSGAFVLALFLPLSVAGMGPPWLRLAFATGFLGAYTTFSTFTWEAFNLVRTQNMVLGLLYAIISVVLGLVAAWFGYALAQAWLARGVG